MFSSDCSIDANIYALSQLFMNKRELFHVTTICYPTSYAKFLFENFKKKMLLFKSIQRANQG